MIEVRLVRWAAWAPGLDSEERWQEWARDARLPEGTEVPKVSFLPGMLRRRCDQLSRMKLHVMQECAGELLSQLPCVFASRYGPFRTMISLLEDLATGSNLSPARFSHSVHNTQAGLFSVWAKNRQPSTSIAARADTFAHGFLEVAAILHERPSQPALLVVGDESLPESAARLCDHSNLPHAVALLLTANGPGIPLHLSIQPGKAGSDEARWPWAMQFVQWLLTGGEPLVLRCPPRTWVWQRHG